jgi:hypothetical protein
VTKTRLSSGTKTVSPGTALEGFLRLKEIRQRGKHSLELIEAQRDAGKEVVTALRAVARCHYVAPEIASKRLEELGATRAAALLRERLPTGKKSRSADFGEILATEVAEQRLGYSVPIRRLRWKDGREVALRGDDVIGVKPGTSPVAILKGEAKSRAALAADAVEDASRALDANRGRPNRHSILFIADRLRERGADALAAALEQAVVVGFKGHDVEHLLFAVCGNDPAGILGAALEDCTKARARHFVGVRLEGHGDFIGAFFEGM